MDANTLNAIVANLLKFQPSIAIVSQAIGAIVGIFRMATNRDVDLSQVIAQLEAKVKANDEFGKAEIERLRALIASEPSA